MHFFARLLLIWSMIHLSLAVSPVQAEPASQATLLRLGISPELQTTNLKGHTQSELRFISKSAKTSAAADFEVPAGFKQVKEADQVTNNADLIGEFADFIR